MSISLGKSRPPGDMRLYAIGDVHGYLDLLKSLHSKIEKDLEDHPATDHRIIFLGDYIDRGPDSSGCVEYLNTLTGKNKKVICLKGNHEAKLESFLSDPISVADSFFTYGGAETAESYDVDMKEYRGRHDQIMQKCSALKENIPAHHKAFYAQLKKTISLGDYMFTHAGVRPDVPLEQQSDRDLMWIRSEFISYQGLYDKVIIHGHTPAYPMEILPNRINVDTHAYDTGVLSCIVLDGTDYRVIHTK